jgi:hypothetical protein
MRLLLPLGAWFSLQPAVGMPAPLATARQSALECDKKVEKKKMCLWASKVVWGKIPESGNER